MKSNELRIGNYFKYGDKTFKVLGIGNDFILANSNRGNVEFSIEDVEPTLLTEEWLLKFGFGKYIGWDDMEFYCLLSDGGNSDRFELMVTNQGYELPSGKICEFVHQLQNCYFFHELTGTELKTSQL